MPFIKSVDYQAVGQWHAIRITATLAGPLIPVLPFGLFVYLAINESRKGVYLSSICWMVGKESYIFLMLMKIALVRTGFGNIFFRHRFRSFGFFQCMFAIIALMHIEA